MASSISFIGELWRDYNSENTSPDVVRWDGCKGFGDNLVKFRLDDQLRWFLDQTIIVAYYSDFYGPRCSDIVNEYINELFLDFNARFLPLARKTYTEGAFKDIVETIVLLQKYSKTKVLDKSPNIELICEFLDGRNNDFQMPWAFHRNMLHAYVPYLIWISRNPTMTEFTDKQLGLISFCFSSHGGSFDGNLSLNTRLYFIGSSFYAAKTPIDDKVKHIAVLHYLAHFNLSKVSFEQIAGGIGELCLHLDVRRSGTTVTQALAAAIHSEVLRIGDLSACRPGVECDADFGKCGLFQSMVEFLNYASDTYGTKATSRTVVSRIFSCVAHGKMQKDSAEFIRDQGGSASADKLESFKKTLGSLEALQFISQSPTLLSAQSQVTEPLAADSEDAKTKKPEPEKKEEPKKETEEEKPAEDDTKQDKPSEDDTSDDKGSDEEGSESETGDDDQPATSGEDAGSSTVDMPVDEDPPPNTSDEDGFEVKVSSPDNETTDSVMFREELDTLLTNILANPPEDMSPQDVETLVALQRYWLHTLSIETILGIVGSCSVQLPESLTKLTTQCTE